MNKKIVIIITLSLIVSLTYFTLVQSNKSTLFFSNFGTNLPNQTNIIGIDISHHQGNVNWESVSKMKINKDSIQFVYLKVTEGTNFKDKKYALNRSELDKLAPKVGVYHFLSPDADVVKQVTHFTNSFNKTTLKPVLDVETIGNLSKTELVNSVVLFLNETEKRLQVRPIIYTYESFYLDYIKGTVLESELFWIANYNSKCGICDQENVIAWQFSDKGTVNGIIEKVDLNSGKDNFWKLATW